VRKQSTFSAQNMLPIVFMRRPGTSLSFEIRIVIQEIITISLLEKAGLNSDLEIQVLTGSALFDQFQRRTPITRS